MPPSDRAQTRGKMGALGLAVWLVGLGAGAYLWILAGSALFRWLGALAS